MSRTTDKYVKVKKASDTAPENEIRIRAIPQIGRYISYAASLLLEKKLDTVLIKASGNAARSACQIAEILRHRIIGLHQLNNLKTISVIDEYEPREEGLDRVVVERKLAVLEITLSLKDDIFDTKAAGYQAPLPKEEVQEEDLKNILAGRRGGSDRGGPRGGRRGGRGDREERGGRGGDRFDEREDRGGRPERGGRRGRYAGPRGRGGRGGRGDGEEGGYRGGRGDREEGGYREGGYRGGRGNREEGGYREGGYRGGRGDREEGGYREGGYRGGRGDREEGGYRGGRGGNRGGRGGYRGGRDNDREDKR